jgi:GT2 family glycosyltransferase
MKPEPISFTVVMATCDRPVRLRCALDAVGVAVRSAPGEHEIVVIDNGGEQSAREAVAGFQGEAGLSVRYLCSEPRNKAAALNAGIRQADTPWLAFTDDDALPEPGWLQAAQAFIRDSDVSMFGGRIVAGPPETPLPSWLVSGRSGRRPVLGSAIVQYAPREESGLLSDKDMVPFGANVFIRKRLFEAHGFYDEDLWHLCGKAALGVEDGEFGIRVRAAGEPVGYCHDAVVVHPIHHDRCTIRSHLRTAYRYGWRDPLVYVAERRPAVEPFRLKAIVVLGAGAVRHASRRDYAAAMANVEDIAVSVGSMVGRLSSAYRSRQRSSGVSLAC